MHDTSLCFFRGNEVPLASALGDFSLSHGKPLKLPPQSILCRQGSATGALYYCVSGVIQASSLLEDGTVKTFFIFGAECLLGTENIGPAQSILQYKCRTNCEILALSPECLTALPTTHFLELLNLLAYQTIMIQNQKSLLSTPSSGKIIQKFHAEYDEWRKKAPGNARYNPSVKDIAQMIGLTHMQTRNLLKKEPSFQ